MGDLPYNEAFHEAVKNLVGGDSLMANDVSGDPLSLGGALAIAFLAFHSEREILPGWHLDAFAKPLLGRRFVRTDHKTQKFCPIRSRQIACVLFKCLKHLFAQQDAEQHEPQLSVNGQGFAIKFGWCTRALLEKIKSVSASPPPNLVDFNSAGAVAVLQNMLAGHPGRISISDGELLIEAD